MFYAEEVHPWRFYSAGREARKELKQGGNTETEDHRVRQGQPSVESRENEQRRLEKKDRTTLSGQKEEMRTFRWWKKRKKRIGGLPR